MGENLQGLVDIETEDKELETLMILHYEGRIKEMQHRVIKTPEGVKKYEFLHLSAIYAFKFLEKYAKDKSFTLKRSSDKKILTNQRVAIIPRYFLN